MSPDEFPLMQETATAMNRLERFQDAVRGFDQALSAGSIRNKDYADIKDTLGRIVERCWSDNVREPFFYSGKYETLPQEIREFDWKIGLVSNLHAIIAASKKVENTSLQGEVIEAMRAVAREVLPLANASATLKTMVVKGRAPNPNPPPENPNKTVRTCPCCFRGIAVTGATMAHHGYQRPGFGYQTSSCPGIRFEPVERSNEGIKWVIVSSQNRISDLQSQLEKADEKTSIWAFNSYKNKHVEVKKDDKGWDAAFSRWKRETAYEIKQLEGSVEFFSDKLKNWVQTEPSLLAKADSFETTEENANRP